MVRAHGYKVNYKISDLHGVQPPPPPPTNKFGGDLTTIYKRKRSKDMLEIEAMTKPFAFLANTCPYQNQFLSNYNLITEFTIDN